MALRRDQYDTIMKEYDRKRDAHRKESAARREEIYASVPGYRALDEKVSELGLYGIRRALSGLSFDREENTAALYALRREKENLLTEAGYPADYLEPIFECRKCSDTGYLPDGTKCECFRSQEIEILYDQSHIREKLASENFSVLSTRWYQGEDLNRFTAAVDSVHRFVDEFDRTYRNLYFYGPVGTGKSFLSNCAAEALIKSGHSVIYFSASALFERLNSLTYDYKMREELDALRRDLYECELLIIDDLGTEIPGNLVASSLFSLLNERDLRKRSTIISTNLSLDELQSRYSARILSRIMYSYDLLKLTGYDIRVQKKQANRSKNDR